MVQLDKLREVQALTKFVSAEPLLEDVSKTINLNGIDWLITGGESGSGPEYVWIAGTHFSQEPDGRRTMKHEWAKNLQAACRAAGTAFYFKQITASRSGQKPDALGKVHHAYPQGPFPWYSDAEFAADFLSGGTEPSNDSVQQDFLEIFES
jgi:protein gp37